MLVHNSLLCKQTDVLPKARHIKKIKSEFGHDLLYDTADKDQNVMKDLVTHVFNVTVADHKPLNKNNNNNSNRPEPLKKLYSETFNLPHAPYNNKPNSDHIILSPFTKNENVLRCSN